MLVVDDEPLAADWLARCLKDMPGVELVGSAADGDEAMEKIAAERPDLVLLDIQMPGRSGLSVARALENGPEVVFVTAFAEHAPEAFEIEAVDYLLKPVQVDRLAEAVRRARRRREMREAYERVEAAARPQEAPGPETAGYDEELWIRRRDGYVRVRVDQIRRIEAARDYALIHTATKTYILRATMSELAERLDPAKLLRVHRSAFVRPDAVARVERSGRSAMRLHTEDGAAVEVGVSYVKRVSEALGLD
ncbi:LytR/AlgR family response regulator transcription factor [Phenylobacterium sp. VNQ135]|uniref:LytR/AlgR family response regulator transcription factor n=1 Tax=Phenylobacterium sp. VNQ135 TaxID=3400922 RepID=UPI003C01B784